MAVSYLANALGQRLSPTGKFEAEYWEQPHLWVDVTKQGWKKRAKKSVKERYGEIEFNPLNPNQYRFPSMPSQPGWWQKDKGGKAIFVPEDLPVPPPLNMPPTGSEQSYLPRLDTGTSGNSILNLMNIERAMNDGQHYPAILHKDEEVINPMASEVFRPVLQQMNQAVPGNNPTAPPVMDDGTPPSILEARRQAAARKKLESRRGSPWAPSQPPGVLPQTTAGRPPIVPAPTDPVQLQLLQDYGLSAPARPVPTTSADQAREAVSTGYTPLGRERYVEPTLDPKKKKKVEAAINDALDIIAKVAEEDIKEKTKAVEKGKEKAPAPPSPPKAEPVPFRPGWNMAGQPMNIDWEYIQSLPTGQAQAILQQYADMQQLPMQSLGAHRAGLGTSPTMRRQQIMQGLMGTYKGGAEMPGIKGEAAYSAEKGKMAGGAQGIIQTDINYKKALTMQAQLQRAVTQAADPMEAAKLRDLQIKQQQATVKIAGERAKLLGKSAVKAYHREYVILQVMMNPTIDPAIVMRGLDELKPEGWWTKSIKERQDETLSLEEVTDIISDFFTPTEEEGKKTTFESHKQSMGG